MLRSKLEGKAPGLPQTSLARLEHVQGGAQARLAMQQKFQEAEARCPGLRSLCKGGRGLADLTLDPSSRVLDLEDAGSA